MKPFLLIFAVLTFSLLSSNVNAQSKTGVDYFTGTWNVLVKGTPNGDARMWVVLEKKDTTMTGSVEDSTGKEISKITSVDVNDTSATVYFNAQGYDVNLEMDKKGEDHITGSLMGMFDAVGDRVKNKIMKANK
ncbi:MAG TPA: hypothetical protein VMU83_05375 [Hanamia sp.]|nr:hypothetical protein [Hanamia sp.]